MIESCPLKAASNLEDLLENRDTSKDPLNDEQLFLAEMIVNIFLIQDSNTHPVFRLDNDGFKNQVGLETIGKTTGILFNYLKSIYVFYII